MYKIADLVCMVHNMYNMVGGGDTFFKTSNPQKVIKTLPKSNKKEVKKIERKSNIFNR